MNIQFISKKQLVMLFLVSLIGISAYGEDDGFPPGGWPGGLPPAGSAGGIANDQSYKCSDYYNSCMEKAKKDMNNYRERTGSCFNKRAWCLYFVKKGIRF